MFYMEGLQSIRMLTIHSTIHYNQPLCCIGVGITLLPGSSF